mmetsp:Transcript_23582/g.42606  ORF Transcript_23582/g.42606 Transcript_23582/m.42606 type:complete len:305 (-) Transcript_23582:188-1102(-)|eukprot:CAMPEP_0197632246 /NCGR_PEP_ID=MMETSP1338-20131121/9086_1 /TAXON_ID=43686 ORGANISM="Pelagodinium beii, Strain RCC1491" /NCGR_SAMPLE_ID=MMETSP1338 /ASSEMBLY_ACC=CAM_ASM_000754 /LENGTH=304 /DNA_ID=CAMNT_0043203801 /DNA_START=64 /DNA_END=978 /DNA_ORIENTATION=-
MEAAWELLHWVLGWTPETPETVGFPMEIYPVAASFLDVPSLGRVDATCTWLCDLNRGESGPWDRELADMFYGMEHRNFGSFAQFQASRADFSKSSCGRQFRKAISLFSQLNGAVLNRPVTIDTTYDMNCCLCKDRLALRPDLGVYVEVEVCVNQDSVSLALESADHSRNISFSPDCGALMREVTCQTGNEQIQGSIKIVMQPLKTGERFLGKMGFYALGESIAFFRRCVGCEWETSGFCAPLTWFTENRVLPCLAFRDAGRYNLSIVYVGHEPPFLPQAATKASLSDWRPINYASFGPVSVRSA